MKKALIGLTIAVASAFASADTVNISATSALVLDAETNAILYQQQDHDVRPIASITKLMTAVVVLYSGIPLDEVITITEQDVIGTQLRGHNLASTLSVGATLTRGELLHLALMSSNNRAAYALARTYPGGTEMFVSIMNNLAQYFGMNHSTFVEPTGLSNKNVSNTHDLALLVKIASTYPTIRDFSTTATHKATIHTNKRTQQIAHSTTNRLVHYKDWDIVVQKTGFINDAGRCVVMMTNIATKKVIIVLLNATSNDQRAADATKIKKWLERQ